MNILTIEALIKQDTLCSLEYNKGTRKVSIESLVSVMEFLFYHLEVILRGKSNFHMDHNNVNLLPHAQLLFGGNVAENSPQ